MDTTIDHSTAAAADITQFKSSQQPRPWFQAWCKKLNLISNRTRIAPINNPHTSGDHVQESNDSPVLSLASPTTRYNNTATTPTTSKQSPGIQRPTTTSSPLPSKTVLHYARSPPSSARILRRLARTTFNKSPRMSHGWSMIASSSSEKSSGQHVLNKMHRKYVQLFLKAPHFVAGGKVTGTVVMEFPQGLSQADLLDGFESLDLQLRGVESVTEPIHFKTSTHTHEFLSRRVLQLGQEQLRTCFKSYGKFVIPFSVQLPQELGSSYKDKKGSVRYQLQAELALSWPDATHGVERVRRKIVCKERAIVIYPNAQSRVLSEPNLYMPVNAERKMWPSSPSKAVSLQLSLGRSIWITETPIYVHVKVDNASTRSVSDIKLELLRRQNTFSQTGLQGSFGLKPVTSTCETVAQVQASQMGWLLPMDPGMEDQATMMLQSPRDHYSIRSQKLIDVSYSIRASLVSDTSNSADAVVELPIVLVHPISLDPPPGEYTLPEPNPNGRQLLLNMFQAPMHEQQQGTSSQLTPSSTCSSTKSKLSQVSISRSLHKMRGWVLRHSPKRRCCESPPLNLLSTSPTTQPPPSSSSQGLPCRWQAPSEKFELVGSCSAFAAQVVRRKYPRVGIKKRMLASSRYLKGLQNKTLSIAADGRRLLQLEDKGSNSSQPKEGSSR